jgi:hypothetical protein
MWVYTYYDITRYGSQLGNFYIAYSGAVVLNISGHRYMIYEEKNHGDDFCESYIKCRKLGCLRLNGDTLDQSEKGVHIYLGKMRFHKILSYDNNLLDDEF